MSLSIYIPISYLSQFFVLTLSIELVLSPRSYFFPLLSSSLWVDINRSWVGCFCRPYRAISGIWRQCGQQRGCSRFQVRKSMWKGRWKWKWKGRRKWKRWWGENEKDGELKSFDKGKKDSDGERDFEKQSKRGRFWWMLRKREEES